MRTITWIIIGIMICACSSVSAQNQVKRKTTSTQETKQTGKKKIAGKPVKAPTWSGPIPTIGDDTAVLPSPEEMAALGEDAFNRHSYAEAMQWATLAAGKGSADAQLLLGDIYLYGKGAEEDHVKAAGWYRKAAAKDHPRAQFVLATLLYFGDGVTQDFTEAYSWAKRGAEKGDAGAQLLLGMMYAEGNGVPASREEARKWYLLSAEQGNAAAKEALETL